MNYPLANETNVQLIDESQAFARPALLAAGSEHAAVSLGERFERIFTALEILSDGLASFAAIWIGYAIYQQTSIGKHVIYNSNAVSAFACAFAALMVLLLHQEGAYRIGNSLLRIKETQRVLSASVIATALLLPLEFLSKEQFPRLLAGTVLLTVIFVVLLEKQSLYSFLRYLHKQGFGVRKVLIYGAGLTGKKVFSALSRSPKLGLAPIAFIDDDPHKATDTIYESSYSREHSLPIINEPLTPSLLSRLGATMVVVAIPSIARDKLTDIIKMTTAAKVGIAFVPGGLASDENERDSIDIDGILLAGIHPARSRFLYNVFKRIFDFFCASALILFSAPLLIIVAVAIKMDSKGPAIFRQKRVGEKGRIFTIYKFRTMRIESCGDAMSPAASTDFRITRVGRILRRTSIDELPQLLNVLKGEMSLVGPRPEMPFIVARYDSTQRRRLLVKPGITGLWQLSADRQFAIHDNIQYDLYYIKNRSFFLDLAILLHTLIFAVRGV